jgi:peptidoglycan/xylan/chitin deacetylase (PgdA/CDA1 family)
MSFEPGGSTGASTAAGVDGRRHTAGGRKHAGWMIQRVLLTGFLGAGALGAPSPALPAPHPAPPEVWQRSDGAIVRARTDRRQLALVFTAHEFGEGGMAILDALTERQAKASFFLTGTFLENPVHQALLRRMIDEGHSLGPHSDRHLLYCAWEPGKRTLVSRAEFEPDLTNNVAKIVGLGVPASQVRYFLPAYEHHNAEIAEWTRALGFTLINRTPGTRSAADYTEDADARFVSSQAIYDSVLGRESQDPSGLNGHLLLFHLGSGPGRTDKMHHRLGALMDELTRRGYAFVRVDELLSDTASLPQTFLRVNQLGYRPDDSKQAVAFSQTPLDGPFEVREVATDRVVFSGRLEPLPGMNWGRFPHHAALDFSAINQPGRYRLRIGDTASLDFEIGASVFWRLPSQHLEFLRQQRCGDNPWLEVQCHLYDGRTAYGPRPAGTFLDARGGWHDAADLLKYLLTSGNATAQLLLAWDLHRDRTNAADIAQRSRLFPDHVDASGRPGTNGVPDVLDEARWGLEWMLRLHPSPEELYHQVADDRDHYGWRLPQDEAADYGWGKGSNRVVYAADGNPQGLGKFQSESTGLANLAGRYAAAMALAWTIWKDDPAQVAFARRCLRAGREVYAMGQRHEGVQQGNSFGAPYRYAETTWADDLEWGAAELFRATGQRRYLEEARGYAQLAQAESWMGLEQTGHYQFYPFLNFGHYRLHGLVDPEFQNALAGWYREGLDRCVTAGKSNPYGIGVPFIWCSNNLILALVTQARFYEQMTGDPRYRGFTARHRDWLLGRNPWGTTMFTGVGERFPRNVHLMTTRLTGRSVVGGLVDGPVYERIFQSLKGVSITLPDPLAAFQDARAVYHDDLHDYASNEPTMDGTASAVLMWAALE